MKHKDNLSRPFEKAETKQQNKLHSEIRKLCEQEYVMKMTYPELFDVMDRVKLTFQLDMCERLGLIKFNKKKEKRK